MNILTYEHIFIYTIFIREVINMKKTFKLTDLDCAHCAAKMEEAANKIDGVNECTINFVAQKMKLDADDARFDEIFEEVVKVCSKIEPDCEIVK